MKTYRIWYYRYYSTIAYKDIQAKTSDSAIKKSRLKNIISIKEI